MGRSILGGVPALAVLAALLLAPPASASLAPGALDPSFGTGGVAGTSGLLDSVPATIGVDGAGRIVVSGTSVNPAHPTVAPQVPFLFRMLGSGAPDAGFGTGGTVTAFDVPSVFGVTGPVVSAPAPGDATLVAMTYEHVFVQRVTASGGIDDTFGTGGRADVGGSRDSAAFGVAPVPGGVLVAWTPKGGHPRVTRLTAGGAIDTTYGDQGTTVLTGLDGGGRMAVAADGSVFAGGPSGAAPAVAALDPDGVPRAGFGTAGVAKGPARPLGDGRVPALALAPDGRLYLVADGRVQRVSAAGAFDPGFAPVLDVSASQTAVPSALAVQPDGDLLVALGANPSRYLPPMLPPVHRPGVPYAATVDFPALPADDGLVVARLTPAGAPDCSYGSGGHARLLSAPATPASVALDGAGRLLTFSGEWPDYNAGDLRITRSGAGTSVLPTHPAGPVAVTKALADPVGYGPLPARATGWVDPRCGNVTAHFEYGRTTAYGARTKDIALTGAGGPRSVSAALPVSALGTYHYRLVAAGPGATAAGHDASFAIRATPLPARLVLALSRANARRGRVAVLMRCRYAACHAVLTLKRRGTVLGNGHAVLGAGDRARVPIRLNAAGRSRVAHHRVSAMVLTIAMANAVTATTPITVRAPRGAR